MRAMILGAGLGTRLRPLTEILPKPAVPFFDRPLAAHALAQLVEAGATDIVINAHHLGEALEPALRPYVPAGVHIEVVFEKTLLGTGGGVRAALTRQSERLGAPGPDEPILLMNGDVLFFPDLRGALRAHAEHNALATLVVRAHPQAAALGAIHLEQSHLNSRNVRRILGPVDAGLDATMFTGVHILSGRALALLPAEGCIVRQAYIPWLASGSRLGAFVETAPFRDCGTLGEYHAAHLDVLEGRLERPRLALGAAGYVSPAAQVAGATLQACSIGEQARVDPGVHLARCVVWPGEHVRQSASDAVLAGGQVLRIT